MKKFGIHDYIDFHSQSKLVEGFFGEKMKHVPDRNQLLLIEDFVRENLLFKKFDVKCQYDHKCGMNKIKSIVPMQRIPSIKQYFQEAIRSKSA